MIVYTDILSGDEMFADSYPVEEIEDGFFYQVEGKWITVGDVEVNTGANASAEEAEEGVDSTDRKVVDIIESFRLVEQPSYDKKAFMAAIKGWLAKLVPLLPEAEAAELKAKAPAGIKYLLPKLKDLQFFMGENMEEGSTLAFAYYGEGESAPTFLFFKYAMKGVKC